MFVAAGGNRRGAHQGTTTSADVTCFFCDKKGHYKSECPEKKAWEKTKTKGTSTDTAAAMYTNSDFSEEPFWITGVRLRVHPEFLLTSFFLLLPLLLLLQCARGGVLEYQKQYRAQRNSRSGINTSTAIYSITVSPFCPYVSS